jgi:hypothetical protein
MSDKLISNLEEKPILADTDEIVIEGGGATWKSSISKFKEYVFGFFGITSSTDPSDYVIVKKLTGQVYKVTLDNLLPAGVVKTDMYADSTSATTGITANKLAPGSVTHPKLAIDAVHTHNIADAEAVSQANYGTSNFGTGITTSKIVDGAVTGPKGGVPVGAVFHFASLSVPAGYLLCNGDVISDNASGFTQSIPNWKLKGLRDIVGTSFGALGSLPDLRGLFVRGYGGTGEGTSGVVGGNKKTYRHLITPHQNPNSTSIGGSSGMTWTRDAQALGYVLVISQDARFQSGVYEQEIAAGTHNYVWAGLTGTWYYRAFSLRPLVSGNFGAVQNDSTKLHFHGTHDPTHGHTTAVRVTQTPHDHSINLNNGGYSSGGKDALRPHNSKSTGSFSGRTGDASANIGVTVSVTGNATGLVVRDSPLDPTPVDETRPLNLALLPCIKY